jgi:hypothetical protein
MIARLPSRSLRFGIGKEIGGAIYVHRNYSDLLGQVVAESLAKVSESHFTIVKWKHDTGAVSLIHSPDFDSAHEPIVGDSVTIYPDGRVRPRCRGKNPAIYHHKWLLVSDAYLGFDVEASKRRSLLWMSLDGIDRKRIGRLSYWTKHVTPLLGET